MPHLVDVADRAHVHPDDAYTLVEQLAGDDADLDPANLPDDIADAICTLLDAATRALAYPPTSIAGDLAAEYRTTRDPALLDELRDRGHRDIPGLLVFEQPQPDDPPSVAATRAQSRAQVDVWIAAAPADPHMGPRHYLLGSPTGVSTPNG